MKWVKTQTIYMTARSRANVREERTMENIRKGNETGEGYIVSFRRILQEAEERDRQALERYHNWSNGMMDPAEDEVYTNAVKECAGKLRKASA